MPKRYYWLKLKENFFEEETIKLLESMENGKDYVIFLLKLRLKTINTNGYLDFKGIMPYNEKMLATITGTNIDIVRQALKLFEKLALIKRLDDGTIYLEQIQTLIGSESDSAERVRKHREKLQEIPNEALLCNGDVTKSNTDIDTEKDIDIDKTLRGDEINIVWEHYKSKLDGMGETRKKTEKKKGHINARLDEGFTVEQLKKVIDNVFGSNYMLGENDQGRPYLEISNFMTSAEKIEKWLVKNNNFKKEEPKPQCQMSRREQVAKGLISE